LALPALEGAEVISIRGLQACAVRLSRLDVERTESDAMERAARDIEAIVKAIESPSGDERGTGRRGRETATSAAPGHRVKGHSMVISTVGSMAVVRELGTAARSPDPFLSAAARRSAPAIAERIGQMFVQLVSGMRND
jgi:hypothetical protein